MNHLSSLLSYYGLLLCPWAPLQSCLLGSLPEDADNAISLPGVTDSAPILFNIALKFTTLTFEFSCLHCFFLFFFCSLFIYLGFLKTKPVTFSICFVLRIKSPVIASPKPNISSLH